MSATVSDQQIRDLVMEFFAWSDATFGDHRNPLPALHHLREEVENELLYQPHDEMEYADALMLLFDAARRAGIPWYEMWQAFARKLAINKGREWSAPDANGVVRHVR